MRKTGLPGRRSAVYIPSWGDERTAPFRSRLGQGGRTGGC